MISYFWTSLSFNEFSVYSMNTYTQTPQNASEKNIFIIATIELQCLCIGIWFDFFKKFVSQMETNVVKC